MATSKARRNLAKTLAASGGVVVLGKTVPQSWFTPVVEDIVLPAHAQTSLPYTISCTVEDTTGVCDPSGIEFRVFGTVSGGDLEGVVLVIEYGNQIGPDCTNQELFYDTTTQVQAGNVFDATVVAIPPSQGWCDPEGHVRVRFQDQSAYGTGECHGVHNCDEVGETP
ncbi:MAG: hypothetical protein WB783_20065 [Arenicellales bacterium]